MKNKGLMKVVVLEILIIFFFTVNGAYVSLTSPYAFFIGMVLSLLIVNKQSIIIAIAFHGLNNFFIIMSTNNGASIFNYFLILILIIYSGYLWNVASKTSKGEIMECKENSYASL